MSISGKARELVSRRFQLSPVFRLNCFADPGRVDPIAGELILFLDGATLIADDLAHVCDSDLWIWPSITAAHLYACAQLAPKVEISACIPEEPTHTLSHGRMWWRYAFARAERANLRLNIGTTTKRLADEYSILSGAVRVSRFPVPHDGAPCGAPKTELRKIGFFGAQRFEKGAEVLPELIAMLLRDGYEVVLHDSGSLMHADEMKGLTVLGYLPSLADEIAKCDLVILPYAAMRYRIRASGILWECMASGVPAIVPANTDIGAQVELAGTGKTFASLSTAEIYQTVKDTHKDFLQ
ncbi:MAG: hypothetical protein V1796_08040, partial [Pseudomonadota bacterium]